MSAQCPGVQSARGRFLRTLLFFDFALSRVQGMSGIMDRRIGAKDFAAAMRAAKRLGNDEVAIVKACAAAEANSSKSEALLAAVSAKANQDLGYALCRLHWLVRHDDLTAAAKLVLAASSEDLRRQDPDEWWRERRLLVLGD